MLVLDSYMPLVSLIYPSGIFFPQISCWKKYETQGFLMRILSIQ